MYAVEWEVPARLPQAAGVDFVLVVNLAMEV
jgi:hypothetical protein